MRDKSYKFVIQGHRWLKIDHKDLIFIIYNNGKSRNLDKSNKSVIQAPGWHKTDHKELIFIMYNDGKS